MKTLSDILELLTRNSLSENPDLRVHAATLLGCRTHGSTTEKSLFDIDNPGDVELSPYDSAAVQPGAKCYRATVYQFQNRMGAISYEYASRRNWEILERIGVHGHPELWSLDVGRHVRGSCSNLYFIVGNHQGEQALFTWHPGQPLVPGVDRTNPLTAVKR